MREVIISHAEESLPVGDLDRLSAARFQILVLGALISTILSYLSNHFAKRLSDHNLAEARCIVSTAD